MQSNILNLSKKNLEDIKIFIIKLSLTIGIISFVLLILFASLSKSLRKELNNIESKMENIEKTIEKTLEIEISEEDVIIGLNNLNDNLEKIINDDNDEIILELGENLSKVIEKLDPIISNF